MSRVPPVTPKSTSQAEVWYSHALCDDALHGWVRRQRVAPADGAGILTEVLWVNPEAAERMNIRQRAFV